MDIEKINKENMCIIKICGRLDTNSAPELDNELQNITGNVSSLIFDLEKLDYISSAGLRIILATQKAMMKNGEMKLINVQSMVMEVFNATGFSDILTIEQ